MKHLTINISIFIGSIVFLFLAARIVAAFTSPTLAPPNGNVAPPLQEGVNPNVLDITGTLIGERNIENINALIGSDAGASDLFVRSNPAETGPIYYGANLHRFYTGGTEKLAILANGNVGIGETLPSGKLEIREDGALTATDGNIVIQHPTSNSFSSIVFPSRVNVGDDYGYIAYYDDNDSYNYWGNTAENSALIIGTQNDPLNAWSDVVVLKPSAVTIIDSTLLAGMLPGQSVGIAQNLVGAPSSAKLVVNNPATAGKWGAAGDAIYAYANNTNSAISAEQTNALGWAGYFSGRVNVTGALTTGGQPVCLADGSNCPGGSILWSRSGTNTYLTNTGDNVGIGTADPQSLLHLKKAVGAIRIRLDSGVGDALGLEMIEAGVSKGAIQRDGTKIDFYAGGLGLGDRKMSILDNGNVGIGTAGPGYKLDVQGGQINASGGLCIAGDCKPSWAAVGGISGSGTANTVPLFTGATTLGNSAITQSGASTIVIGGGTGKLTVGTIDPVYEIGGKKYATYVADVAGGVKTEVTGTINVKCQMSNVKCQDVIDFDEQQVGSDLWLFWETSTKNAADITALLTPGFEGNVWYEKIPSGNKIIIRSNQNGEVSFRLTAPRKDAAQWPNEITE